MIIKNALLCSLLVFVCFSDIGLTQELCPSTQEIKKQLDLRRGTLETLNQQLNSLLNGELVKEVLPSALFAVDINDAMRVEKRIKEITSDLTKGIEEHPLFSCVKKSQELSNILQQIFEVEKKTNELRLQFLSLTSERRQALLNLQEQAMLYLKNVKKLELEKTEAQERSRNADQALKIAEQSIQSDVDSAIREVAAQRIILEKTRKEMADLNILWAEKLKVLADRFKRHSLNLSESASILSRQNATTQELFNAYTSTTIVWRSLLEDLFNNYESFAVEIPSLPRQPKDVIEQNEKQDSVVQFLRSFEKAKLEASELEKLKTQLAIESKDNLYRLVLLAGKVRSQLIRELNLRPDIDIFSLSNDNISDLAREIRLVPYRPIVIAKNFLLEIRDKLSGGFSGWLALAERLFILFMFISTPFISYWLMLRGSKKLELLRSWLIKVGRNNKLYLKIAYWIYQLNPYLTWATLYFAIGSAAIVIKGTELEGLGEVLPYFEYYFLYRIFRVALGQAGFSLSELGYSRAISNQISQKIERTGKFIGLFFLFAAYLLEATEAATREALFYHYTYRLVGLISPIILSVAATWWKSEIKVAVVNLLPDWASAKLLKWIESKWNLLVCLPALILVMFFVLLKKIYSYAARMDSAKRVSAQLFRRKIESVARQGDVQTIKGEVDSGYQKYFDFGPPQSRELMFSPESIPYQKICGSIESWINELSDEHTMAIQGEKGIGKSSILSYVDHKFSQINRVKGSVPPKIINEVEFFKFLNQIFSVESLRSTEDVLELDKKIPKTLVLIDEGQNLFLAKRGGFNAFHLLSSIFNLRTNNIMWCMAFNRYSWAYLNAVTGGSQFFRKTYSVEQWSDLDIQNLILSRHEQSGYTLEFDPILYAINQRSQSEDLRYIQDRFFEMLWEQARGNPRTAFVLWLSSLTQVGEKNIRVGLPESSPSRPLDGLTDEELFVIAAVVRHENLTVLEAADVCNLSERVVRHAVRVGLERGFLSRSGDLGRYRVQPMWQAALTSQLVSKNFVYE